MTDTAPGTSVTAQYRAARDFLLAHRTDYATAVRDFQWPQFEQFNWALDWFDVIAQSNHRPALVIVEEDGSTTTRSYAELAQRSNQVANWLRAHGVARGDRVIVMLGNQLELWENILAAMKLGAVIIPAATLLRPADLHSRVARGHVDGRAGRSAALRVGGHVQEPAQRFAVRVLGDAHLGGEALQREERVLAVEVAWVGAVLNLGAGDVQERGRELGVRRGNRARHRRAARAIEEIHRRVAAHLRQRGRRGCQR